MRADLRSIPPGMHGEVQRLHAEGLSLQQIADQLATRGVQTSKYSVGRLLAAHRRQAAQLIADNLGTALQDAARDLQSAAPEAIAALRKIIGDDKLPAAARVSAARTVLVFSLRGADDQALMQKLEELEQQLAERGEG